MGRQQLGRQDEEETRRPRRRKPRPVRHEHQLLEVRPLRRRLQRQEDDRLRRQVPCHDQDHRADLARRGGTVLRQWRREEGGGRRRSRRSAPGAAALGGLFPGLRRNDQPGRRHHRPAGHPAARAAADAGERLRSLPEPTRKVLRPGRRLLVPGALPGRRSPPRPAAELDATVADLLLPVGGPAGVLGVLGRLLVRLGKFDELTVNLGQLYQRKASTMSTLPVRPPRRVHLELEILGDRIVPCWIDAKNVYTGATARWEYASSEDLHAELAREQNNGWMATGWIATSFDESDCSSMPSSPPSSGQGGSFPLFNVAGIRTMMRHMSFDLLKAKGFKPGWEGKARWFQALRNKQQTVKGLAQLLQQLEKHVRSEAFTPEWQGMRSAWENDLRHAKTAHQVGELAAQLQQNLRPQ